MTFISSLIVKKGIILVSDGFGFQNQFSSFGDQQNLALLQSSNDSQQLKIPSDESLKTFKPGRIKNLNGAKMTFQITEFSSLQFKGVLSLGGQPLNNIISQFIDKAQSNLSHIHAVQKFIDILHQYYPPIKDAEYKDGDTPGLCFIYCHFEPIENKKQVHIIQYLYDPRTEDYRFTDLSFPRDAPLYYSIGMQDLMHGINDLHDYYDELSFKQGYNFLELMIKIVLTARGPRDNDLNTITYSIIDSKGFRSISSESDLPQY